MKFGKKLTIIGLIIFGIGVPSTATSMTMIGDLTSFGQQYSFYVQDIIIEPNEKQNIKKTLRGHNPILVYLYANPEGIPFHITMTNYEHGFEALSVVSSNSTHYLVEPALPGTYDFDFVNLGDQKLYLEMEVLDAKRGKQTFDNRIFFEFLIYVYHTVFFGGIIAGILGATIWKIRG